MLTSELSSIFCFLAVLNLEGLTAARNISTGSIEITCRAIGYPLDSTLLWNLNGSTVFSSYNSSAFETVIESVLLVPVEECVSDSTMYTCIAMAGNITAEETYELVGCHDGG